LTVITALDDVAWLLNIRGSDVAYCPLAVAFAVVGMEECVLFVDGAKIGEEVRDYLRKHTVEIRAYDALEEYIRNIPDGTTALVSKEGINFRLYGLLSDVCRLVEVPVPPVTGLKCVKNAVETAGFRDAVLRDGVAMVRFLIMFEGLLASGKRITERDIAAMLKTFRSEQELYVGESFAPIVGYGANGAMVHYSADGDSDTEIRRCGVVLIDSGAHYLDGTTDITRTIACGAVPSEIKHDFTLVLKGCISLSSVCFPSGTTGSQIDALSRQFLWNEGLNYLHGTGHGVGHCLNVHEGPQRMGTDYNSVPLAPGMVISCEPGIYRAGEYGIRIENLLLVVPFSTTLFGNFYAFETLTLCPIDMKLIDITMLTDAERRWLNRYHGKVFTLLAPLLNDDERAWLGRTTAAI
jgi:Xaa-Pro aminopeptidase